MYLNKNEKHIIISTLKEEIPELQALYLFGSYVDGTANYESDIDIAYLSSKSLTPTQKWHIAEKLANLLSKDVDLIELFNTNTIFRYQILSSGIRMYGEGYAVESFETLAYSFYLRFQEERKPILDEILKNKSVYGTMEIQGA